MSRLWMYERPPVRIEPRHVMAGPPLRELVALLVQSGHQRHHFGIVTVSNGVGAELGQDPPGLVFPAVDNSTYFRPSEHDMHQIAILCAQIIEAGVQPPVGLVASQQIPAGPQQIGRTRVQCIQDAAHRGRDIIEVMLGATTQRPAVGMARQSKEVGVLHCVEA